MSFVEKKIKKKLDETGVDYEEFEHEAVHTSEEAAEKRGLDSAEKGIKSLLFRSASLDYVLVVTKGNKKVDTDKIAELEGTKKIKLAKPKEVKKKTGVEVGAVAPFGLKNKFTTYLDQELLGEDELYFNPGNHEKSIKIQAEDLPKLIDKPKIFSD